MCENSKTYIILNRENKIYMKFLIKHYNGFL